MAAVRRGIRRVGKKLGPIGLVTEGLATGFEDAQSMLMQPKQYRFGLSLTTRSHHRDWFVACEHEAERDAWREVFETAIAKAAPVASSNRARARARGCCTTSRHSALADSRGACGLSTRRTKGS